MKLSSFEQVAATLNRAGVRYLVADGLAVNAYGYLRLTHDVDLVVGLDAQNIIPAFAALADLGYRPVVPVTAEQFADRAQRERWIGEKGMEVLNFQSEVHKTAPIDVFVREPFDFDVEYGKAMIGEISPGLNIRFVSITTLIAMKQVVGRPRDLDDIEHLKMILEEQAKR